MHPYRRFSCLSVCFVILSRSRAATQGSSYDGTAQGSEGPASIFLRGEDLGAVPAGALAPSIMGANPEAVKDAAQQALLDVLQTRFGIAPDQASVVPIPSQPVRVDERQRAHVRFQQEVQGLLLEGASLSILFNSQSGKVQAVIGDVHTFDALGDGASAGELDCVAAMALALVDYFSELEDVANGSGGGWDGDCQLAAVQGMDGKPYLAYKRLYGHPMGEDTEPYRLDLLFADRVTGHLVAVHPQIMGARTMATYDCKSADLESPDPARCTLASTSPNKINKVDPPLDDAHNNAIDVYKFYERHFGLKGMDGNDKKVQSLAHYGKKFAAAFYNNLYGVLVYGDGDGVNKGYLARFDVVAHEFSHGVTAHSSRLIYKYESGALNEGFSDAMAAAADRLARGKSPADSFRFEEDVTLQDRRGIRNMANPPEFGNPDFFPNRYLGKLDDGGVHTNSGITNKAFFLMVQGGVHPVSGIVVPPLSADFDTSMKLAATIYFNANTMCLRDSSDFLGMRDCTLMKATRSQRPIVAKAWDAVGVKASRGLSAGKKLKGLSLPYDHDVQVFKLDRTLSKGENVTCRLKGRDGDPDLSVRFGRAPRLFPLYYTGNNCWSATRGRKEECTTGPASANGTAVYVAVESYSAASDMELVCTIGAVGGGGAPCAAAGDRCDSPAQCCDPTRAACDGRSPSKRVCKACKAKRDRCSRSTECCGGLACAGRHCA